MSYFTLLNQIIVFSISILGIWLMIWVYFANKKGKENQWFTVMTFFVILWITFAHLGMSSSNASRAILLYRLNWGSVAISAIAAYFFIIYFPRLEKRHPILEKIILTTGLILFFLSIFTNLIIKNVKIENWGTDIVFGKGGNIFSFIAAVILILIIFDLFKKYFKSPPDEQLKIKYFLVGGVLFVLGNFIFNIFLPFVLNTARYQAFGDYSAIFLLGFTAYAIVKQNLFGIRVVITQIFVVLITLLLLTDFLTSQTTFEYIWKGAVLVAFAIFGWLLIKSVTREIKQKEQLAQYSKDLATANLELQSAYTKLETLDKAKSEFISIASHQLRTPLTAIKGYVSLIIEGDYGKIPKGALQSMKNVYLANERLAKLVNSLLDMSRIEAGKITLSFSPVKIDDLVADILRELRGEASNKNLKLRISKDRTTLPKIEADGTKLRDALMNLVDNAIKYTDKGEIVVKIKYDSFVGNIEIVVQDTGEGMTQEEINKLFQSFSRADAGQKNWAEGSGLGLYIAKKFIEMHHGTIHAESQGKGLGSKFIIELPVAQPNKVGATPAPQEVYRFR
ncbi:MAG: ATP-binding protein [Candidatus Pacebacteria bacterium]|nr:ATP-binding protein [Candidatus Paceibacterota bacterium]